MSRIAVIGAGAWGTALACVARRAERETILWARDPGLAETINARAENPRYLPGVPLVGGIAATADLTAATQGAGAVLLVVPAQFLRKIALDLAPTLRAGTLVAICAKGVEQGTLALMSEFVAKEPGEEICRQGADADMFYILESGEALLEVCSTR